MKKFLALLLVAVMCLSLCGTVSAEDERPTITILMQVSTNITDIETNAYTKHLEDTFNVNLDFVQLPNSDASSKLDLMINSGETLPYVINYNMSLEKCWQYAEAGALVDLTPYYEDPEFNSNLVTANEMVTEIDLFTYVTCPDGCIYTIPRFQRELHSNMQGKLWVNQTWIDEVGLGTPTTTDEFYTVFKKIQENHPESLGLIARSGGGQADIIEYFMNSFIYDDGDEHFVVNDGVLDVVYDKDEWKAGLAYVKKLYDEGIIYADSFTLERTQQKALALQDDPLICAGFTNSSISLIDQNTTAWQNYEGLAPLAGPEGVRFSRLSPSFPEPQWFVTKDCPEELVDLCVQIGIFMFDPTETEFILDRFGVQDVDWRAPYEGEVSKYDGFAARYLQLHVIWNMEENSHWQKNGPHFAYNVDQGEVDDGDPTNWSHKVPHAVVKYLQYKPADGTYVPKLVLNEDEIDDWNEIRTNLKSVVDEWKVAFVTGQKSLDTDWDEYISVLNSLNYKGWVEAAQVIYDRMYK